MYKIRNNYHFVSKLVEKNRVMSHIRNKTPTCTQYAISKLKKLKYDYSKTLKPRKCVRLSYGNGYHYMVQTTNGTNVRLMFERFTEKAIKVVMLAQEEARRLGHNFVGTEQILLGLIGESTGIAAKVLKLERISLKEARVEVEKIIGRGSGFVAVEIPFTPRAKRVLEMSLEEARQLGHNYIGTEHILLGLLREGEGVAARVLETLGADPSKIRALVVRMVGESQEAVGVGGQSSGSNKTPTLEEYGSDLTAQASGGSLDPVVGRTSEIERVIQILGRRTKNNPCLVGY
jgi:ATP-dependent Clp protease ATP-binding subunit ClpC